MDQETTPAQLDISQEVTAQKTQETKLNTPQTLLKNSSFFKTGPSWEDEVEIDQKFQKTEQLPTPPPPIHVSDFLAPSSSQIISLQSPFMAESIKSYIPQQGVITSNANPPLSFDIRPLLNKLTRGFSKIEERTIAKEAFEKTYETANRPIDTHSPTDAKISAANILTLYNVATASGISNNLIAQHKIGDAIITTSKGNAPFVFGASPDKLQDLLQHEDWKHVPQAQEVKNGLQTEQAKFFSADEQKEIQRLQEERWPQFMESFSSFVRQFVVQYKEEQKKRQEETNLSQLATEAPTEPLPTRVKKDAILTTEVFKELFLEEFKPQEKVRSSIRKLEEMSFLEKRRVSKERAREEEEKTKEAEIIKEEEKKRSLRSEEVKYHETKREKSKKRKAK
jgi:hypothetical protein